MPFAVLLAATLGATGANARTITIDIKPADVQAVSPTDASLGNYYTFDLDIPEKLPGETFMDAFIELVVDATSDVDEMAGGGITTLEIFPLNRSLTTELTAADLRPATMKYTVRTGESQRVRANISEHIRYLLDNPSENYGLALGSLTGQRLSKFTLKQDVLGEDVMARVTVIFHDLGMSPAPETP